MVTLVDLWDAHLAADALEQEEATLRLLPLLPWLTPTE